MNEKTSPIKEQDHERLIQEYVYEALFPGQKYKNLPASDAKAKLRFAMKTLTQRDIIKRARIIGAITHNERVKERIDFVNPDKDMAKMEFEQADLSKKRISSGAIYDQLKPKEKFGGVAVIDLGVTGSQIFKADIIGVLNETGEPTAYILFSEGLRRGKRASQTIFQKKLIPILKPVGNRFGIKNYTRL